MKKLLLILVMYAYAFVACTKKSLPAQNIALPAGLTQNNYAYLNYASAQLNEMKQISKHKKQKRWNKPKQ